MKKTERIDISSKKQTTVLLVDDHAILRQSLKLIIETERDIRVVAEAKDGLEAVPMAKAVKPEVIVMDIAMPLLNGLQATEKILAASPETRILILSAHPDPEYIYQAMRLGASGYLLKQSSLEFVAVAIREVKKGNTYLSRTISKKLRDQSEAFFYQRELAKKAA